ncbi:F0F1 ATP synthase subunit B [Pannonibacter indicus]|uniref:ATP synthase subunit b n=1 Tax=Pannonibacter indicus TaxID=466044 RepID=A0A0K6HUL2_9HYPH|nr:F0F1 ATP synthase subunit B [Pannonibacter indicus]CUA94722.1 FoF1-type ATP synthase, membrane subunit b or b' [Pannonibacter indicus]
MAGETHTTVDGQVILDVPASEHGAGFPPFDPTHFVSQLFWLFVTFLIFYWIMKNVALPRIAGILEDRHDRIAGDLSEAERLKRETDEAIAAYEQALSEARARARAIAQDTREKLKAETDARRATAEQGLAAKLAEADAHISSIKDKALAQVGEIASETSSALVEALIGVAPAKAEADAAVQSAAK